MRDGSRASKEYIRAGIDAKTVGYLSMASGHEQLIAAKATKPLPFLMMLRRPKATRFEINTQEQRLVGASAGTVRWKMIPTVIGAPDATYFRADEISFGCWVRCGRFRRPAIRLAGKGSESSPAGADAYAT